MNKFKKPKIEQCPECNGAGAFNDIVCCGCCVEDISTQRICNCCEGSGWVDTTIIETQDGK